MKKLLLVVVPLLLIAGAVGGLAFAGIVNVPFLPFGKKKHGKVPPDDGKGGPFAPLLAVADRAAKEAATAKAQADAAPPPAPKPTLDPGPGEAKLAGLWASMPTDRVAALVARWPEGELGRILAKMDDDATAKLLAALPPPRAASLSRALAAATDEKFAQKVKKDSQ